MFYFLLHNPQLTTQQPSKVVPEVTISESFKRKLSKREKKQLKKLQEKTKAAEAAKSAAEKLYNGMFCNCK